MGQRTDDVRAPMQSGSDDIFDAVSDIWMRNLGRKARVADANLIHIGVGTRRILRLLDEIDGRFGVKIPIGAVLKLGTVEGLANAVRTRQWPGPSPLILLKDGQDRCPLYLIAGAWGLVLEVCTLATAIEFSGKIWGLQPPGFDGDAPAFDSVQDMAAHYVANLRGEVDEPVNVIGFSFGGLIAVEMARILHRQGRKLGLVGLIDTPIAEKQWPLKTRARYLWGRTKVRLRGVLHVHGERRAEAIRAMVRPFLNRLRGLVSNDPSVASAYQPSLDIRIKAVLDRIIVANEKYAPLPIEFPMVLFKARPDPRDLVDVAETWRPITKNLQIMEVEGRHGNMTRPPIVFDLARAISACLRGCDAASRA